MYVFEGTDQLTEPEQHINTKLQSINELKRTDTIPLKRMNFLLLEEV